ncbi:hypothetical protein Hanom_Chr10g00876031 [Helianthus anomalus]
MRIGGHVAIDWAFLETVGEAAKARDITGLDTLWSRLFETDPDHPFHEIRFRLAREVHEMSLETFAVHSELYTPQELATDLYTDGIRETDTLVSFWMVIAMIPFGKSSG